jgi:hypothetical protein
VCLRAANDHSIAVLNAIMNTKNYSNSKTKSKRPLRKSNKNSALKQFPI